MPRLDMETRVAGADHQSIRLWLRLLTCSSMIESQLRTRLRERFDTTLPRFDFLAQLERVPEGLTMGELSRRMMVSGGNISGIAVQLGDEGIIERWQLPENRRTHMVKLTAKGRRQFAAMAAEHEQWVIEILDHLSTNDIRDMMRMLGKLKTGLPSD